MLSVCKDTLFYGTEVMLMFDGYQYCHLADISRQSETTLLKLDINHQPANTQLMIDIKYQPGSLLVDV